MTGSQSKVIGLTGHPGNVGSRERRHEPNRQHCSALHVLGLGFVTPANAGPPPSVLDVFDATSLLKFDAQQRDQRSASGTRCTRFSALQGLVNRDKPHLYVYLVGDAGRIDHYWLDLLRKPGQWLEGVRASRET